MKTSVLALIASLALSSNLSAETAGLPAELDLGDAQSRSFANPAALDWYEQQRRIAAELRAEHLLAKLHEGEVRAGELSAADIDQIAATLSDPRTIELLETSHYYSAVVRGEVAELN
ncbi:MAG: hypothetical protein EOM10_09950 [Opitutae bacterium]|nr:hypothetical protein [Opitutae bacterium]